MVSICRALCIMTAAVLFPVFLAVPALAQSDSCLHRTVSVTAVDRNGAPILDLRPADFRAEYRRKPVRILSVVPDNRPHRIVILLDASGSLGPGAAPSNWQLARAMASHLAESKLQMTSFALLIFNDRVQEQIDFSQGPEAMARRLQQIGADPNYQKTKVRGKTALWDTLIAGQRLLREPTSADTLYAITDGGENASRAKSTEVRRRLAAVGSRVFVCLLAPPFGYRDRTPEEASGRDEMNEMAHATGGAVFGPVTVGMFGRTFLNGDFSRKNQVSDALNGFYQAMLEGYSVGIELPSDVDKWREWQLELSKAKQKQFKDAQLRYTLDLAPCKELLK